MKDKLRKNYPDVQMIGVTELRLQLATETPPLLLDVRSEEEYQISKIAGAKNIINEKQAFALLTNVSPETHIVVYCSLGYRSANLARALQKAGYTNVHNVEGSLFEWVELDYPVYRDEKRVYEVHPYNFWWGRYLRPDYRAYQPVKAQ